MMKELYHFTSREACRSILHQGFKNGIDGYVWFCEHPTTAIGEKAGQCLLRVYLELDQSILESYAEEVEFGFELDPETDEFVKSKEPELGPSVPIIFYAIPAEVLNPAIQSLEKVPDEERYEMML